MLYIALAETIVLALFIGLVYRLIVVAGEERSEWMLERRELLNRVQFPDRMPIPAPDAFVLPEQELDDMQLVGTIKYDEESLNAS